MLVKTDNSTLHKMNTKSFREVALCIRQESRELAGKQYMTEEYPKQCGIRELVRERTEVLLGPRFPKVKRLLAPSPLCTLSLKHWTALQANIRDTELLQEPCPTLLCLLLLGPCAQQLWSLTHWRTVVLFESDVTTPYRLEAPAREGSFLRFVMPETQLFLVGVPWFQRWWTSNTFK